MSGLKRALFPVQIGYSIRENLNGPSERAQYTFVDWLTLRSAYSTLSTSQNCTGQNVNTGATYWLLLTHDEHESPRFHMQIAR